MSINKDDKKYFASSSLALVATLSLSFPIEKINRKNPGRVIFVFKNSNNLQKIIDAYWKDELKISPQRYFDQLKSIKNRIYV